MNIVKSLITVTGLALVLAWGSASAQTACDPKKEICPCDPKKEVCDGGEGCSPGYYKNHIEYWWGIYCDDTNGECASLLTALTCKGNNDSCGRSDAADYLNGQSGCTE